MQVYIVDLPIITESRYAIKITADSPEEAAAKAIEDYNCNGIVSQYFNVTFADYIDEDRKPIVRWDETVHRWWSPSDVDTE